MRTRTFLLFTFILLTISINTFPQDLTRFVNPFIGTTNYGTTNPGAVYPHGMVTVCPFNVTGSKENKFDKDAQWFSTPYEYTNTVFTGLSHISLSGVGCPELGSLLLMPTTGKPDADIKNYGSKISRLKAEPGLFSCNIDRYNIQSQSSATLRTGISEFTFPAGESNILLNLGEGLTNESGAFARIVSDTEVEGMKLLGTFCYNPQAVFPVYFVMKVSKTPKRVVYWKKQRPMTAEAAWDNTAGTYKFYEKYNREIAGDDIGIIYNYETQADEKITVKIGISYVSIDNARKNLETEQPAFDIAKTIQSASSEWESVLSKIKLEGGTDDQKTIFYTALYHLHIHPNILQDVNGEYPAMESGKILTTTGNRYTVFSLWDTYRNVHPLLSLLYPDMQLDMVHSMLDMYRESGWLPKWELFSRETLTMEGDPSLVVLNDTWQRGLRNFDTALAYEAMTKSATLESALNLMRPDNDDYLQLGYVPLREKFDNSVSHALEYYLADWNLAQFAKSMGKKDDYQLFLNRSLNYKNYFDAETKILRPKLPDGKFLVPFNPSQGANFEDVPGFHEGSAWNYAYYIPHDIKGLSKLMGGKRKFVDQLQMVFDKGYYDMANEPDIAYPYLFNYFKGVEWRTQKEVTRLINKYFTNTPGGLPGNDDCGTMSAWLIYSMMGFYPVCPGDMNYALTTPVFDKITIQLDPKYYKSAELIIEKKSTVTGTAPVQQITVDSRKLDRFFISHDQLTSSKRLVYK